MPGQMRGLEIKAPHAAWEMRGANNSAGGGSMLVMNLVLVLVDLGVG